MRNSLTIFFVIVKLFFNNIYLEMQQNRTAKQNSKNKSAKQTQQNKTAKPNIKTNTTKQTTKQNSKTKQQNKTVVIVFVTMSKVHTTHATKS